MKLSLLPQKGTLYKVNLHCHTNVSDGNQSPEDVKRVFKEKGYSAVCYTDHEVLIGHEDLCDEEFVALHGYEIAIKKDPAHHTGYFMPVYHFNFIAEKQDTRIMPRFYLNNPSMPGDARRWAEEQGQYDPADVIDHTEYNTEWINNYLKAVTEGGFLVTYNHPQWSLQDKDDYIGLENLHAIEAINGGCRGLNDNTSLPFEQMLRAGKNVVPVAGDDNHSEGGCFYGWTMIKAEELTYDALIAAYKKGDCFASEGPDFLSVTLEEGTIKVECSPVVRVDLLSEGRCHLGARAANGASLCEVSFPYVPEKFGSFFRLELTDAQGKRAYSRAYRTADLIAK